MSDTQSNTYTFLFTDIEGSSRRWERHPEAMRLAIARHDEIMRTTIEELNGQVFLTAGDSFSAAFPTAPQAVSAAIQIQRSLHSETWELETPLQVRIALHTCEAEAYEDGYLGAGLNRVGRLLSVCHGGQTILSQATQTLVQEHLPERTRLTDLGQHRLRDLSVPERIFQLFIDGLPDHFPALKTVDAFPNNLPVQITSFIGREREISEVKRTLRSVRLLTLTGPGGTGKSRLSLQVAADELPKFNDGAWLVELAPLYDPDYILPTVAKILDIREVPGLPLQNVILENMRERQMLLLLDNCEHLIETCAIIAERFLQSCPGLKIIASSREPLGIVGEAVFRLPSLSLPAPQSQLDAKSCLEYEAVSLFVERAQAVDLDFEFSEENKEAVLQICRRLDGIPLALELAAARIEMLSTDQIASRLDNRFRLLTGGSRTALPRQQTLQALIDWSYELLSEDERAVFRNLSTFSGGWTFAAAEAICGEDVLDHLANLINKSLVLSEEDKQEHKRRYRFLETMRQYASDRLVESGEAELVRDRHLSYFAGFLHQADEALLGPEQRRWIHRLDREQDNLRLALEWGLERNPQLALQMSGDIALFWTRQGHASEAYRLLGAALDRAGTEPRETDRDENRAKARAYLGLGMVYLVQGQYQSAVEPLEHSVALFREIKDPSGLSYALGMLGLIHQLMGNFEKAKLLADESMSIGRENEDSLGLSMAVTVLAQQKVMLEGDYTTATQYINEIIIRLRAEGNEWFAASALFGLGVSLYFKGELAASREHLSESHSIFLEMGDRMFSNVTRSALADLDRTEGRFLEALQLYQQTVIEWRKLGNKGAIARCLECMAFVESAQANRNQSSDSSRNVSPDAHLRRAAILLGTAAAIRADSGSQMAPSEQQQYEHEIESIKDRIGPADFSSAWEHGKSLDMEQAIKYSLEL